MNLAQSIRIGLAIRNKKKSWLAKKLGVSDQYIGLLCKGDKTPSTDMIENIAATLEVKEYVFIQWGDL